MADMVRCPHCLVRSMLPVTFLAFHKPSDTISCSHCGKEFVVAVGLDLADKEVVTHWPRVIMVAGGAIILLALIVTALVYLMS